MATDDDNDLDQLDQAVAQQITPLAQKPPPFKPPPPKVPMPDTSYLPKLPGTLRTVLRPLPPARRRLCGSWMVLPAINARSMRAAAA
jgi:hypothetical protein